jgi:hypothetical protein
MQAVFHKISAMLVGACLDRPFRARIKTSQPIEPDVGVSKKAYAWKVCVRQNRTEGSNPSLSAKYYIKQ